MKAGVAGVKGVEAGSGRVGRGARKFGVGVQKAGIHTEIEDFTGLTRAGVGHGSGEGVDLPGLTKFLLYTLVA